MRAPTPGNAVYPEDPDHEIPGPEGCSTGAQLLQRLVMLRRWSGQPSLRRLRILGGSVELADGTWVDVLPETTVSAVLRGHSPRGLPRLALVEAFVRACLLSCGQQRHAAGQVRRWRRAWRALAAGEEGAPDPAGRNPAPTGRAPTPPGRDAAPAGRGPVCGGWDPALAGWDPALPVPRQLPRPIRGFAGREPQLAQMEEWSRRPYDDSAPGPLILVTGPPGIGKSALVVQWAHRSATRFPDGQLYADLSGNAEAHPVIIRFLRALGVRLVPDDEEEASCLYRSVLAGKLMLVVLDNARSLRQVRPLLPGSPTCTVVVSARAYLADLVIREGALPMELSTLSDHDAFRVLSAALDVEFAHRDREECRRYVVEAGGSPLALRILAESLIRERNVPRLNA
ncbi:AAA family ATPase [Nonomuraea sp. NPDC050153]|uniref:AAA family ATPase n=1 Tax=Nonomuraea sp. NPDC050153 TaxID=3364359 RepID=UPI00379E0817